MNKFYQLVENEEVSELYIFGDVVDEAWSMNDVEGVSLCKQIQELNTNQINVYINSYGGSVSAGLAIYNTLKTHNAKVTTICQGFGCSIASVIFMAGDERIMSDASLLMIHNAWTVCQGNAKELRKQADDLDKITQASVSAYMSCVNISEEELVELLDAESWLTAEECLEMGFATEVIKDEVEAVSQSVKQSLIDMIKQACKDDEKQAEDNQEDDEKDEDDIEDDDDMEDDEAQNEDEKNEDEKKQGTELKAMSSFLNLFK